jgi:hypothetical protein
MTDKFKIYNSTLIYMADQLKKFANKITGFFKSRTGLSMFFALQIFIVKTTRTKTLVTGLVATIIVVHIIGMHMGVCPLKASKICELLKGK